MKLLHCIFDCTGVNKRKQLSRVRPKIQQYNPYKKKTYPHVLYVVRNRKIVPLIDWYVPKPPTHLINQYEKDKTAFTTKLNLRIQDTIKELSGEGTKEKNNNEVNTKKPLTEKQEEVMKCLGKNTPKECVKLLNLKLNNIYFHKRYAEKKGYRIKEFS
jgi:DNA-binding CsgD family transcriptional regulator